MSDEKGIEEIEAMHLSLLTNNEYVDSTSIIKGFKERLKAVRKNIAVTQSDQQEQELERLQAAAEDKLREQQSEKEQKRTNLTDNKLENC